ncbi:glycine/D-amino acid oxidase [Corynebacterium glutamicum]|uniref:N-methyl-L-tryptophan oxidase n=1 Tax=Corynebacterium glutamicum TaxID=1718 RepID=UPI00097B5F79|nr:N-methyl-L-tryptophan oxidase [Corynebacterium glutamicum]GAV97286.1 glycine/D-amino acid oxidase [Corynebacterium glutamicum]
MKIAVIGLGSTGSMALWHLSNIPGVEAIGFEQFGISHGYGAFTGESRLFRMAYHEGSTYVPLLKRARALWSSLSEISGRELFHNFGVLSTGKEDEAPFQRLVESVERYELPHERLTAAQMRKRYPGLNFRDEEAGIVDLQGGALRPELAVFSAIEAAQANGAQVRDHQKITSIEDKGDHVVIQAGEETTIVDRVIVTTGSWTSELVPSIAPLLEVRRLVLTWFLPNNPVDFQPENLPCFIRDRDGFHVFGAPCVDGYSIKIAGLDEWGVPLSAHVEDEDLRLDRDAVSEFGRKTHELFPGVNPEPNRFSVHYDTYTADKSPIIDAVDNVIVLTGGSGHAFKLSPAYGELAAQLAVGNTSPLYSEDFRIASHEPIKEAVHV